MGQGDRDQYGSIEAAKILGISLRQLYHWVDDLRVVEPDVEQHGIRAFRRYSPDHINRLSRMRDLVKWGYNLQAAAGFVRRDAEPFEGQKGPERHPRRPF